MVIRWQIAQEPAHVIERAAIVWPHELADARLLRVRLRAAKLLPFFTEDRIFGEGAAVGGRRTFEPKMTEDVRRAKYDKWLDAVTRSFAWADE